MNNVTYFDRFKQEMLTGDIMLYENDEVTKEKLGEKIRSAFALGDIEAEQARELYALVDYAVSNAKIRAEQKYGVQNQPNKTYANLPNFVSNPQSLEDRRSRANYWRLNNPVQLTMDTMSGKNHRFMKLWDEYSKTNDEGRREEIVQIMEKMYPTTTQKLKVANEREGRSR